MRNLILLFCFIFISVIFLSCEKTEHKLRVINRSNTLYSFTVGSNFYGNVAAGGGTSEYKDTPNETSHNVIAISATDTINGSVFVSGKGKHNWSLSLTYDKNIVVGED
ncbi:MAG: hypothetical protein A2275_09885 [Bacteroidetes bacterium RIFOXYA12_FULL_35_11]|nr:MAG: hypothetical protein A2X01_03690 [Bacteroidetes bacterium GWF2_35_48]OFY82310.1 MAG: hypothetical protein A2275_09885 [Bacteroidetes bacterium RIFOXYA12_FULL_35_11]OFY96284.1 MAG: hypothetical protein A2491_06830 [Bacteroidetes bacterium RIFOXYC12_FULL_35_7]OFY97481.1 MAG: hypothetical protein A2309_06860 [Bacteroidetes bacterium RIFOXYB2_FULL_35_7]HBX51026.1 hypothetical protein [Bacteroidales bacterium]